MNVEPIELTALDGMILRGQHWAGGDIWVVLFHDVGADLDCWRPLVPPLLARGYSVLTLDLRGHGASDGEWNAAALGDDLTAAIAYAHQSGVNRIAFIGAGESALPALRDDQARHLFAMVALSPGPLGTLAADDLRGSGVPKLLIIGSNGDAAVEAAQQLRARAIGWIVLMRLPTAAQGTALLAEPWRQHVQEQAIAFLEEQRYVGARQPRPDWSPAAAEALFRRLFGT